MAKNIPRNKAADRNEAARSARSALDGCVGHTPVSDAAKDPNQHKTQVVDLSDDRTRFIDKFVAEARLYLLQHKDGFPVQRIRICLDLEQSGEKMRLERKGSFSRA